MRFPFDGEFELTAGYAEHLARVPPSTAPGVDWALPKGTPVLAVEDGQVVREGWSKAGGRYVKVGHGDGVYTYYAHLQEIRVRKGERVQGGAVLGLSGNTGRSTGPHLHFGVQVVDLEGEEGKQRREVTWDDPAWWLPIDEELERLEEEAE